MSWWKSLLDKVSKAETVDFVMAGPLTVDGHKPALAALKPDETYLEIDIKALRLPYRRQGVTRYNGLVHTFVDIARRGSGAAVFAAASTPTALAGLDPKNVSKVLTIDKQMVGPTPWNGGDLKLQIGLFSVAEQDLAGPFLSTLTAVSDKVGGAFVAAAKPFVDIINDSMKALSRQEGSVRLEVGLDWTPKDPVTGYYAVIAARKDGLKDATLDLDSNDFRLRVNGADYLDKPYVIVGITAGVRQERWGEIEALRSAYEAVQTAILTNKQSEAEEAMQTFRRMAVISPELITADAIELVAKVEARLKLAFGEGARNAHKALEAPSFEELALYGDVAVSDRVIEDLT